MQNPEILLPEGDEENMELPEGEVLSELPSGEMLELPEGEGQDPLLAAHSQWFEQYQTRLTNIAQGDPKLLATLRVVLSTKLGESAAMVGE